MRQIACVSLALFFWVNAQCAAQEISSDGAPEDIVEALPEAEVATLTEFELADNPAVDKHIVELLKRHVSVFNRPAELLTASELRLIRYAIRKEVNDIVATEGYFSPVIGFTVSTDKEKKTVLIGLNLGEPTKVASTEIKFIGTDVTPDLQRSIRTQWLLPKGAIFRDDDWSRSKNQALDSLTEQSYAAAKISYSEAIVQDQLADLSVELDSGPGFRIGALHIKGLNMYQPWLVDRYHPPETGEFYNREALLKFQRELQNSPYFSSVTVNINPDPAVADALPVEVLVTERKKYDVGLSAGFSSNTGARGEVSVQDRNFLEEAYNLKSVVRIEQRRQIGYVDMFFPPQTSGYLDSVGALFDRTDLSGLVTAASSFGVKRTITENDIERRFGLSFIYEQSSIDGGPKSLAKALVPSIGWTRRKVDNAFDPRAGYVAQLDIGGATKAALSDQNFARLYGKFQYWMPVFERDVILLRAEGGLILSPSRDGIPEEYLFRAGGTGSVRGYLYQSLGVSQDNAIVGGRMMATASAEYVHWLQGNWGLAAFVDEGNAADKLSALKLDQGVGTGVRFKTPAGPIALDVAYGREVKKFRLDFSIGIAF